MTQTNPVTNNITVYPELDTKQLIEMLLNIRFWHKQWRKHSPLFGKVGVEATLSNNISLMVPPQINDLLNIIKRNPDWETDPTALQVVGTELQKLGGLFNQLQDGYLKKFYATIANMTANPDYINLQNQIKEQKLDLDDVYERLRHLTFTYIPSAPIEIKRIGQLKDIFNEAPNSPEQYLDKIKDYSHKLSEMMATEAPLPTPFRNLLKKAFNVISLVIFPIALVRMFESYVRYETPYFWKPKRERMLTCAKETIDDLQFQQPQTFKLI